MTNLSTFNRVHRTLLLTAVGALCIGGAAMADLPSHLTAVGTVSPAVLKPGGTGILTLRLIVASGFHVNSVKPTQSYLVPTSITVGGLPGFVFGTPVYPKPVTITEGTDKVLAYQGTAKVTIPFKVKPGARSGNVLGAVSYQACTTASCFPPTVAKFSTAVKVK